MIDCATKLYIDELEFYVIQSILLSLICSWGKKIRVITLP